MAIKGYEHDDDELKPQEKKVPLYVSWAAWAIVAISLFFMYRFTDNRSNRGQIEFGHHLINSIVWFLLGIYFYFLYVRINYHNPNAMELKIISLFAGIAALAKCILVIINDLIPHISNIWSDAYSLIEAVAWGLMAVFFFLYWWRMHDYDLEGKIDDDYLDDEN